MARVDKGEGVVPDDIPGNATAEIKGWLLQFAIFLFAGPKKFGRQMAKHLELVEASIIPNADEPSRKEARVVLELTVTEDMLNSSGKMHGASITLLVDLCTTLVIAVMLFVKNGNPEPKVSQNINIIYHAPASLGDRLRLINTSMAIGTHTCSGRMEMWDVTHHRLVASATHVMMNPSSKL